MVTSSSISHFLGNIFSVQKIRHEDMQTKFRSTEQQFRQNRLDQDRLNEELTSSRRSFDQQLSILNNKSQDSLKKITTELDRTLQRLNEYERFIHVNNPSFFSIRITLFI